MHSLGLNRVSLPIIAIFLAAAVSDARGENPYGAHVAQFVGDFFLGKALDEVYNATTGQPDLRELDSRLKTFEGAVKQVDERIAAAISDFRRDLNSKVTREDIRAIVDQTLANLEQRIRATEKRQDRLELRVSQLEEVFGFIPFVPPSPLLRSSVEDGAPAAHPLTVRWAQLLCRSVASRQKLDQLTLIYESDAPQVVALRRADDAILKEVDILRREIKEEVVKSLDERQRLLKVERLRTTHPKVREFDDKMASLLWLKAVTSPVKDGPEPGRLAVPQQFLGPACSDILIAFDLAKVNVSEIAPLFRQLIVLDQGEIAPLVRVPASLANFQTQATSFQDQWREARSNALETDEAIRSKLMQLSRLHPEVLAIRKRQSELLGQLRDLHDAIEEWFSSALVAYLDQAKYERPTTLGMASFRRHALARLASIADLTSSRDWSDSSSREETWQRVIGYFPLLTSPCSIRELKAAQTVWAKSSNRPVQITNKFKMDFVLLPPGQVTMKYQWEGLKGKEEIPIEVTIAEPLYVGKTEVSIEQYEAVMQNSTWPWLGKNNVGSGSDPATYVDWNDAVEFCRQLSLKEGVTYRLLNDAEWEYACRAGTTSKYYFGDDSSKLKTIDVNFDSSANPKLSSFENQGFARNSKRRPRGIGGGQANPFGLHDMYGNVWEWCSKSIIVERPSRDDEPSVKVSDFPALRGGAWDEPAERCQSSSRGWYHDKFRECNVGFRVAQVISAK